jgi:hypothetical protein
MKAADCVAPRGGESATMNERMVRHGVVEGAVLCVLELAEVDEREARAAAKKQVLVKRPRPMKSLESLEKTADGCDQQSQLRQRVTALRRCAAC